MWMINVLYPDIYLNIYVCVSVCIVLAFPIWVSSMAINMLYVVIT